MRLVSIILSLTLAIGSALVPQRSAAADAPVAAAAVAPRPFSPTSFWNSPLPATTPTDPKSDLYIADIQQQIRDYYGNVAVNTTNYSAPVYTVSANQPTTAFKFFNCQNKTWVDPNFMAQISAVPVPDDAVPSAGTDSEMVIWQPSTDTVWELWKAEKRSDGWYACWGGKLANASTSQGVFAQHYGVAASGLSLLGGMMRIDELQAGSIEHTIDMSLVRVKAGTYSWPANRTDGWVHDENAIPEGQRFRLDPTLDVDSLPDLTPFARQVAKAAQKYGIVIRDKSGAVNLYAENPSPQIATTGVNPYDAIFEGKPQYSLMNNFPWHRVQALPFDYGKDGHQESGTPTPPVQPLAQGYRLATAAGAISSFGEVPHRGNGSGNVVGMTNTKTRNGYWMVTADGSVQRAGDAVFYGHMKGQKLSAPLVGMAATSTNNGYYLLGRDGGVFSYGDASFHGSTGSLRLNQPVVAMATVPGGEGYWFVAADGGIFAFGPDAHFFGSMGGFRLNKPIVGMAPTPTGKGYWLVASDGGVFSFGDAAFYGSTGNLTLTSPIVGMTASPTGAGYRFVAADGGVFCFGDAQFKGSLGDARLTSPVVAMSN